MGAPMKVLLAEDEEHIAKLIRFILVKEGFDVTHAKDGQEAVDLLTKEKWNLITLDVMMPHVDGWGVLKAIRSKPEMNSIPVLMLTAKGQKDDESVAQGLGATDYLKKPFDPKELARVAKELATRGH